MGTDWGRAEPRPFAPFGNVHLELCSPSLLPPQRGWRLSAEVSVQQVTGGHRGYLGDSALALGVMCVPGASSQRWQWSGWFTRSLVVYTISSARGRKSKHRLCQPTRRQHRWAGHLELPPWKGCPRPLGSVTGWGAFGQSWALRPWPPPAA